MSNILFYSIFTHACDLDVKVTDLEILNNVFVNGFVISYHPNPVFDLVYIWYDYRVRFRI